MARDETIKLSLIDGVTKSLSDIQRGVGGVGAELAKLNQVAELAGKGFGVLGDTVGAIGDAVIGVANLEDALAALQAVTGATAEEFALMKQAAVDASERTRFTAIEATQGLTELARAGLSAADAVKVLNPVLAIAQGNNISVAQSAELLTTTLKQFGAAMAESARFADVLQATADGTATSVEQIGSAMSYVAPLARLAGDSIEETSAIIGALADQGFRGERAGTALRNVFSALADPASKFSEALDDAGIQSRDFATVIEALGKKGDGAKKILLALDSEARPAILSLVNSGGGAIAELTAKLEQAGGAAERTSAIMGDTFNAALARLQNSLANLRDAALEPALEPLTAAVENLQAKVIAFADSEQFGRLRDQIIGFATDALDAVTKAIDGFDFQQAATDAAEFARQMKTVFDGLVIIVQSTADAIVVVGDGIAYVIEKQRELAQAIGLAEAPISRLNVAARETGKGLDGLGAGLDKNKRRTRELSTEVDGAANTAQVFATAVDDAGKSAAAAAENMGPVPRAAHLIEVSLGDAAAAADTSTLSMEALQKRLKDVRDELNAAAPGSPHFVQLAQDAAALEAQIAKTKAAIDEASGANDGLADSSDRAARALRSQASASDSAASAADRAGESARGAAKETENYGNSAKAAKVSLGNYSRELIELGKQMQSQAFSARAIIDVWAQIRVAYDVTNRSVERAIDVMQRQNTELSEEQRIRQQVIAQYGNYTTRIEELIRLKIEQARANREANDEAEREIQIVERRQQQISGGIGITRGAQAQETTPASVGGRGAGGGQASRSAESAAIVINVQSPLTDEASAREFVSRFVVPALARLDRLSR